MEITPNTPDVELSALSTSRRASEARRDTLERLASLCTPRSVSVSVTFVDEGAACSPDEDRPGEAYVVRIPTTAREQPGTDLPDAVWNKRVQVGLLFHELGHVRYSDFERFEERLGETRPEWREVFKTIYNAAEDGVVETQIANEFRVTEDLTLINEAFTHLADSRHRRYAELFDLGPGAGDGGDDDDERPLRAEYSVLDGIRVGLLDNGFTKGDRFAALLDPADDSRTVRGGRADVLRELVPALERYVAGMLSEPDPTARVELAWEFFQRVRERLAPLPVLQTRATDAFVVRPADAGGDLGGGERAGKLPSAEEAEAYVTGDAGSGRGGGSPGPDGAGTGDESGGGAAAGPGADRSRLPPGWVAQRELRRHARRAARGRTVRGNRSRSPLESDAHDLRELTRTGSTGVERVGIADADGDGSSRAVWEAAVERARQLEADLATQLHRRRRTGFDGGHRSGRLDGSRVTRAVRGDQRVFQRRSAGDDRDYSCILILDRSGSMGGDGIDAAERAVAQLLAAFDAVDVDVGLLSLFEGVPYLEVPMGGTPTNHLDRFLRGDTHGGTPLAATLSAGRSLLEEGEGSVPLVFVVTDGMPDSPEAYRRELAACSFPVFGVYVGPEGPGDRFVGDTETDAEYFDRLVRADGDSLDTRLRELVRSLFRTASGR